MKNEVIIRKRPGNIVVTFTLLELLIVLAVIMVLCSLLLPALNRARSKAHEINCLNNLKQLGIGGINYLNDYNHYIPARRSLTQTIYGPNTVPAEYWTEPLTDAMGLKRYTAHSGSSPQGSITAKPLFWCPAAAIEAGGWSVGATWLKTWTWTCYGQNYNVGRRTSGVIPGVAFPSHCKRPSQSIWLGDKDARITTYSNPALPILTANDFIPSNKSILYHDKFPNMLMLDGHAEKFNNRISVDFYEQFWLRW